MASTEASALVLAGDYEATAKLVTIMAATHASVVDGEARGRAAPSLVVGLVALFARPNHGHVIMRAAHEACTASARQAIHIQRTWISLSICLIIIAYHM